MPTQAKKKSAPHSHFAICEWFKGTSGRYLLEQERACLESLLPDLFGYYFLQVGDYGCEAGSLAMTRIKTRVTISAETHRCPFSVHVLGSPEQLPFASDSIDAVLLAHTLDFAQDPRHVLREVERVLIPEGRVLILGFNPYSVWGVSRLFLARTGRVPWGGRFISVPRLWDWLSLLGFDVEVTRPLLFRPPLRSEGLMKRLEFVDRLGRKWWPVLGGAYAVQAVKRVSRLTPITPRWHARARMIGVGAVEPTTRSGSYG